MRTNYICAYDEYGHSYINWTCIYHFECMGFDQVDEAKSQKEEFLVVFYAHIFFVFVSVVFESKKH